MQISSVSAKPSNIFSIKNPCDDALIVAVETDKNIFYNINSPSEKVQLAAIRKYPDLFCCIESPSEKVILVAINLSWRRIEDVDNPSEKVQLAAVTQNCKAIRMIYVSQRCEKAVVLSKKLRDQLKIENREKKKQTREEKHRSYWLDFLDRIGQGLSDMGDQHLAEGMIEAVLEQSDHWELKEFIGLTRKEVEEGSHRHSHVRVMACLRMMLDKIPDSKWKKYKTIATVRLFELRS